MMRSFRGFITKEFMHIFRDKRTLVILFGMPIIQLILFGFAIRNDVEHVSIAVLDHSKDQVTREITQNLAASKNFTVLGALQDRSEIRDLFKKGLAKEVVVFEPDFERNLNRYGHAKLQVITDATDPNMAQMAFEYTRAMINNYQQRLNDHGREVQIGIEPRVSMLFNPELKSVNMFVPGLIAVILMLVSALMTSISITREKETGTMEVLLVSPLKPYQIIIGKVIPYMVLSLINVVTIIVLALVIFRVPFNGSFLFFGAESLLFIFTALSLGVFISTISNNQQTALMISLAGLLLPTVILSGFIFPVSSMPVALQIFSNIVPAKWFLIIVKGIMLKGVGITYVWKETLVLAGMTLLLILLSMRKFKVRLQ